MAADMAEIHRLVADGDHEGVVAAANKLIKAGKSNPDVIACKVVACLHANKFNDAVEACGTNAKFAFHKAYALYKLDKLDDAWTTLEKVSNDEVDEESIAHLKAQVLYRQTQYAQAVEHYQTLLVGMTDADPADRWDVELNLVAALVSSGKSEGVLATPTLADSVKAVCAGTAGDDGLHYELIYNIACALLDAGRPAAAASALEVAITSGAALLSDEHGSAPSEVAEELAPLRAQAALLLQEAGYEAAAVSLYASMGATLAGGLRKSKLGAGQHVSEAGADPATAAVAVSNLAGLHGRGLELVEGYTRIAAALQASTASKLTRRQLLTLRFNRALLAFSLRRYTETELLVDGLLKDIAASGKATDKDLPLYLSRLADSVSALSLALDHVKAVQKGDASAGTVAAVLPPLAKLAAESTARRYVSPVASAHVQLLLADGNASAAATALSKHASAGSSPMHPAVAASVAQLNHTPGEGDKGVEALDSCAKAWIKEASGSGARASVSGVDQAYCISSAVQALHAKAALQTALGKLEAAAETLNAIAIKTAGATSQQKAAALATLAVVRTRQAVEAAEASHRASFESQGRALLQEAAKLAGAAGAAQAATTNAATLEWVLPGQVIKRKAAAVPAAAGAAAAGTTAAPSATGLQPTADLAAVAAATKKAEAKRRRAKARRAKRRAAYMAKLTASGKYEGIGIPRPDAERWIAKKDRMRRGRGKGAKDNKAAYGHQGGGDAGLAASLDARARAEKDKEKPSSSAAAGGASPSLKGKPGQQTKGGKRK